MAEPVTGTGVVLGIASGVTAGSLLVGIEPGTAIGAFAGAVVFVLSAVDFPIIKRLLLFVASFAVGLIASDFAAGLTSAALSAVGGNVSVERPVGAIIASAAAVRVLMMLTAKPKAGGSLFDRFGGGGQ